MLATLIGDIVLICALSVVIILLCHWLRIPPIIGFLLTGIVAGPYGVGLIEVVDEVEVLAEIASLKRVCLDHCSGEMASHILRRSLGSEVVRGFPAGTRLEVEALR